MIFQKKEEILNIIRLNKYIKVSDLQKQLQIPRTSLLRYLSQLESEGNIIKTFGEVKIRESHIESLANPRIHANRIAKQKIAEKAAQLVAAGDIIFLDGGSTTFYLAKALINKNVTIYTNNLLITQLLNNDYKPKVLMISGEINKTTLVAASASSINDLIKLTFDKSFIGFNSFINKSFSTTNAEEATLKEVVIQQTRKKQAYALGRENKSTTNAKFTFANTTILNLITNGGD